MTVVLFKFQQTWNHDFFVSIVKLLAVISTATNNVKRFLIHPKLRYNCKLSLQQNYLERKERQTIQTLSICQVWASDPNPLRLSSNNSSSIYSA